MGSASNELVTLRADFNRLTVQFSQIQQSLNDISQALSDYVLRSEFTGMEARQSAVDETLENLRVLINAKFDEQAKEEIATMTPEEPPAIEAPPVPTSDETVVIPDGDNG